MTFVPSPNVDLSTELRALLADERDLTANAANTAALLFARLPDLNWAGFYWLRGTELVLGPFQGKPACVRIPLGRGVCGTAALQRTTVVVPDVHQFPGHIACDAASQSEIVVPLVVEGRLLGVLDVDSPRRGRFGDAEVQLLEAVAAILLSSSQWPTVADEGASHTAAALSFLQLVAAGKIREAWERHGAPNMRHRNTSYSGNQALLPADREATPSPLVQKRFEVRHRVAEGDCVAVFSEVRFTPDDTPTAVAHLFQFENDRIADLWEVA